MGLGWGQTDPIAHKTDILLALQTLSAQHYGMECLCIYGEAEATSLYEIFKLQILRYVDDL